MSNSDRMRILIYIGEQKRVNVQHIMQALDIDQSLTSQHLRILRAHDVVKSQREGRFVMYSLNLALISKIKDVLNWFSELPFSEIPEEIPS